MNKLSKDELLDQWIVNQVKRITGLFIDILNNEMNGELQSLNEKSVRTIYANVLLNMINTINFAPSVDNNTENREEIFAAYREYAEGFVGQILDVFKALYSWEPEQTIPAESDHVEEGVTV